MKRNAFTLAELMIVLTILVVVAAIVIPLLGNSDEDAKTTVTNSSLVQMRDVVLGRYRIDMGSLPLPGDYGQGKGRPFLPQVRYLFVNPKTETALDVDSQENDFDPFVKRGWRGPYLMSGSGTYSIDADNNKNPDRTRTISGFLKDYGETGDPAVLDGWGNPIVIVSSAAGVELRSAGKPKSIANSLPVYMLDIGVYDHKSTNNIWLWLTKN